MYNNLFQQSPYYQAQMPQYQRFAPATQEMPQIPINYQQSAPNYIKGRPVVSIDEAKASQIDLDGSLYVFPDLGNKKIYTKQINLDGTATFNVFELAAPGPSAEPPIYVTRTELDAILTQFKESLTPVKAPEPAPTPHKSFNL